MNEKRVIAYIRVSTDRREQESSIRNQKLLLQQKYGNNVEVVADVGSGLKLKTRPNFVKMLTEKCGLKIIQGTDKNIFIDIDNNKEKEVDLIVVKSISRFSRNTETIQILNKLSEKGVYVFFEDIQKSTEGQDNALIINLLLSIAQQESLNTSTRIKQAFKVSANQGNILGNDIYGYKYIQSENRLEIIEEEAKVVRMVFDMCINGKGARLIAKELNDKGIKTQRGNNFSASSVKNMIKNKKYCGYNIRNKWTVENITSENARIVETGNEIVEKSDKIPAIIDIKVYNKAMEVFKSRVRNENGSSTGKNYIKDKYREKCLCGVCGGKMYVNYSSKKYANVGHVKYSYLTCCDKKNKGRDYCNNPNMTLKKFEEEVQSKFKEYNKYLIKHYKEEYKLLETELQKLQDITTEEILEENKEIKNKISNLKNQTSNVINALVNAKNTTIAEVLNSKIVELSNEVDELESKYIENISVMKDRKTKISQIKERMKEIEEDFENPKLISKEEWITKIGRIEVMDKKINISY
jgi:site-specific DNA recombinase